MSSSKPMLIYGAGGHGRVVAEVASNAGASVLGFLDDTEILHGSNVIDLLVYGGKEWLVRQPANTWTVALALGDNSLRRDVAHFLESQYVDIATIISSFSSISLSSLIGIGSVIMSGVVVNAGSSIGRGAILNTGAIVEHDVQVSDYAHVSPRAVLGGGAIVGALTHIAIGATVLPRVRIGARCLIGAGSVVTKDVPDDVVAYGCPARIQRSGIPLETGTAIESSRCLL